MDLFINERVMYKDSKGTVKYIGELKERKTNSVYVGVEWDDEHIGKHKGVVDGYRYFTCDENKSGSLINVK